MIKMKALRPFGFAGQHEGHIGRGREFTAASDARAKDLESHGLAFRLETNTQPQPSEQDGAEQLQNKAAASGPLDSVGGETGAESAPSSSAPARQPRKPRSNKPAGALDL